MGVTQEEETSIGKATLLRRALWVTAFYNVGGALLFFFPVSVGQLVRMPVPVPVLYSWFCAAVIAIFGGVYAWLAMQEQPLRPFLIVSAIGKVAFFVICVVSWLSGESSGRLVAFATVDLVFAGTFVYCLPKPSAT